MRSCALKPSRVASREIHFHFLQRDAVYLVQDANDDGPLSFYPLPIPSRAETAQVAARVADRLEAILKKHGRSLDPDEADSAPTEPELDHPALAACYSAAALGVEVSGARAGQPALRLGTGDGDRAISDASVADEPVAEVRGINLYGKQWIDGRDRRQLERLFRYITRPPVAQERLSLRPDGTLLLEFKKAWKDGTRALVLSPDDLLVRLCAAIAPPRFHMLPAVFAVRLPLAPVGRRVSVVGVCFS